MKGVRYSGALQAHNSDILAFGSPFGVCWTIAAREIAHDYDSHATHLLEIGCGEGHASRVLLEETGLQMDLIDINPKMTAVARRRLRKFGAKARVHTVDAFEFLASVQEPYPVIFSSFVLHNFPRDERRRLLNLCRKAMRRNGLFLLNDCIPPDRGDGELLARQIARYKYLPDNVAEQVIAHVKQDARPKFRMPQRQIIGDLCDAGFLAPQVIDRIEREALIIAYT